MRLHTLVFISVTPVLFTLASCGDDETSTASTASTGTGTSTGTGGEGGGTGGMGGTGGGAGGMGGMGGGMGGMGGAGGGGGMGGGGGSMAKLINGCDPATATDMTGMMKVTIDTQGLAYVPKCVRVKAGSDVTWKSNFTLHPLVGGVVDGVNKTPDPNSPIKPVNSGMMVTYTLANAGDYGFYCDVHATAGMNGAVFVE